MTGIPPLTFRYIDGHMVPRSRAQADRHYVDGETYTLEEHAERSLNSHNHYHAALTDVWKNLPDELAAQMPSKEHLRKKLLIRAGYCDEQQIVFTTTNDAIKASAAILARDDYCVADVQGRVLTIWTAKSQSMKAMNGKEFADSKQKVLDLAAELIGTTPDALTKNAGQAA